MWVLKPQAPAAAAQASPAVELPTAPKNWKKSNLPEWKKQMFALQHKFPTGWKPVKKLSRAEIAQVRATKRAYPNLTLNQIGAEFGVSPEAVRRILKSKYRNQQDRELE